MVAKAVEAGGELERVNERTPDKVRVRELVLRWIRCWHVQDQVLERVQSWRGVGAGASVISRSRGR